MRGVLTKMVRTFSGWGTQGFATNGKEPGVVSTVREEPPTEGLCRQFFNRLGRLRTTQPGIAGRALRDHTPGRLSANRELLNEVFFAFDGEDAKNWFVFPEGPTFHGKASHILKELVSRRAIGWAYLINGRHDRSKFANLADSVDVDNFAVVTEREEEHTQSIIANDFMALLYRDGADLEELMNRALLAKGYIVENNCIEVRWTDGSEPGRRVDDRGHQDETFLSVVYSDEHGVVIVTPDGDVETPGGKFVVFSGKLFPVGKAPEHYSPAYVPGQPRLLVQWQFRLKRSF